MLHHPKASMYCSQHIAHGSLLLDLLCSVASFAQLPPWLNILSSKGAARALVIHN